MNNEARNERIRFKRSISSCIICPFRKGENPANGHQSRRGAKKSKLTK